MMAAQTKESSIQLLSAKQLGALLALSKRQVFRLNACGKIPKPILIGGSLRWRQSDIERWQSMGCPDRATFEEQQGGIL